MARGGIAPSTWKVRLGLIVVVAFNILCAVYVGSFMQSTMTNPRHSGMGVVKKMGAGSKVQSSGEDPTDASRESLEQDGIALVENGLGSTEMKPNLLVDNVDRLMSRAKSKGAIVYKPLLEASEAKPKASPPVWAWPPRPHSLVPPTKPVPLIRGVPEQYALSLLGLAATRTKAVLDRQPPQARPRKPAKPCAARTKCMNVVYAALEDDYPGLLPSMTSALAKSKASEQVCFHIIVPMGSDAGKLCRMVSHYHQANTDRFCSHQPEILPDTEVMCPEHPFQVPDNINVVSTSGVHWSGACYCSSSQVQILHFDPGPYDAMQLISAEDPATLGRRTLDFALTCLDEILLPRIDGSPRIVYLEPDTIVQADLKALMDTKLKDGKVIAPAKACSEVQEDWFNFNSVVVNMTMDREDCVLNTGVFMMDLPKFQSYRIGQRIKELVVRHKIRTIWVKNSIKAPLILALQGHVQRVDSAWDVMRLGIDPNLDGKVLDSAFVLHWTGPRKPWTNNGLYKGRWSKFQTVLPIFHPPKRFSSP